MSAQLLGPHVINMPHFVTVRDRVKCLLFTNKWKSIMPHKSNKLMVFIFISVCLLSDISAIYTFAVIGDGLPRDWGVMGRLVMPLIFYLCGWKVKEKNKKNVLYLIGTSRLLYYNSIIVHNNFKLAVVVISIAFLADIMALYQSIMHFKLKGDGVIH
jgi:hypothetical protein